MKNDHWILIAGLCVMLGGAIAPAHAQTVDLAECKTLAEYFPSGDVAYKPGVDVHGNPVVPADINAAPIEMPDIMSIPLSVDLAKRIPGGPAGLEADASVGFLEVHKTGRILFEGQDWTAQVHAICSGQPLPVEPDPAAGGDGQGQAAPVESPATITPPNTTESGGVTINSGEARTDRYN